jgi:hypothetical protein
MASTACCSYPTHRRRRRSDDTSPAISRQLAPDAGPRSIQWGFLRLTRVATPSRMKEENYPDPHVLRL